MLLACGDAAPTAPAADASLDLSVPAMATKAGGQQRVPICHRTSSQDDPWIPIEVTEPAVSAHLDHGDAPPGDPVPGTPGYISDDACVPVPAGVDCNALFLADPALDEYVHRVAGVPEDQPLTPEDVAGIRSVNVRGAGVTSIDGLQCLPDLQNLNLIGNEVSDLSPLEESFALRLLYLNDNQVSDVTPLQNIGALQYLLLDNNQVSNLDPILPLADGLGSLSLLAVRDNPLDCESLAVQLLPGLMGPGFIQTTCPAP